jgi:hypothetical protein
MLLAAAPAARADSIACHLSYGGESRLLEATPVASPYAVPAVAIGSYFMFRIVFLDAPSELAGIKLYTYADHASGPALIHQSSHPYPVGNAASGGFTGRQRVYEPVRDGELEYWCELKAGTDQHG